MVESSTNVATVFDVVTAYQKQYLDPIVVSKGALVTVGERDQWRDQGRLIWCVSDDGKAGGAPETYVQIVGDQGNLLTDYSAVELSVAVGERLNGFQRTAGWVWCINERDEQGWVPLDNLSETASL